MRLRALPHLLSAIRHLIHTLWTSNYWASLAAVENRKCRDSCSSKLTLNAKTRAHKYSKNALKLRDRQVWRLVRRNDGLDALGRERRPAAARARAQFGGWRTWRLFTSVRKGLDVEFGPSLGFRCCRVPRFYGKIQSDHSLVSGYS